MLSRAAVGYLGRVYTGSTADIDTGSYSNSLILLFSGDFGKVHYDANLLFNEQGQPSSLPANGDRVVHRAQFAQTFAAAYGPPVPGLTLEAELYHFTQPTVHATASGAPVSRANTVGALVALAYALRPNLVFDVDFEHGLTSTSTQRQYGVGFTYLLPYRLFR